MELQTQENLGDDINIIRNQILDKSSLNRIGFSF
jgi:hypothetical protein